MNNPIYYKSLKKIKEIIANDGVTTAIVEQLKALRVLVVEENQPLLAKAIRLIFQHIVANNTFNIEIPEDEPIEGFEKEPITVEIDPVESLSYLFSNMENYDKKMNEADIRGFVVAMKEQAGED
ncbi:MAG: hypothetical protein L3J23_06470 [Flavobacteriaceae bacterium]|nr:hypothetical protein [Flavobacteriaceae bacterium]